MKRRVYLVAGLAILAALGVTAEKSGLLERRPRSDAAPGQAGRSGAGSMAGMPMDDGGSAETPNLALPQQVVLSPEQQVLANVKTVKVVLGQVSRSIRTVGVVDYDQTRISHLTARLDGRLDRVAPLAAGDSIRQGQDVGAIYSPDLIAAEQELHVAKDAATRIGTGYPEIAADTHALLRAATERLRLWGLSDRQIAAIGSGKAEINVPVLAPLGGVVTARKVEEGQYVKAGDVLFDLADLSRVWIDAAVHEADLGRLAAGSRLRSIKAERSRLSQSEAATMHTAQGDRLIGLDVAVNAVAYPGRRWRGRVAQLAPALDPQTRTLAVRIELHNPGLALRPQMNVGIEIRKPPVEALIVPASAVMDTGTRHVVWVKIDPQTFEPRTVTVGALSGEVYPVLEGLKPGEEAAVSGGFLLDASAQMQAGL